MFPNLLKSVLTPLISLAERRHWVAGKSGIKTFFIPEMCSHIFCSHVCLGQLFGELCDLLVFI